MHLERADPICPRSALCGADRGSGQPLAERARSMTTRQIHLWDQEPLEIEMRKPILQHFLKWIKTLETNSSMPKPLPRNFLSRDWYFIYN